MTDNLKFLAGVQLLYTGLILNKYINISARKYGSKTRAQLDILHTLIVHGGTMKPTELSKLTFRSKQTVTEIIDNLETNGCVKRELKGKDHRTKKVIITRKGLESIKANLPNTLEISDKAIPNLTKERLREFNNTLKQIRKHLLSEIDILTGK
jgi:DNA-binding MarR family transcriptional regulator